MSKPEDKSWSVYADNKRIIANVRRTTAITKANTLAQKRIDRRPKTIHVWCGAEIMRTYINGEWQ